MTPLRSRMLQDLRRIQLLLGHTSLRSTSVYLNVSPTQGHTPLSPLDIAD